VITFLTSCKPFTGPNSMNQVRAIRSWLAVAPGVEVIVYGRSEGAADVCALLGIRYVPEIECTQSGLPYLNAIAAHARDEAIHDTQVYLNCDILLDASLLRAVQDVQLPQYVMIGQRVDLDEAFDFESLDGDWLQALRAAVCRNRATLHSPAGMDYFVFTRGLWGDLPPVVIGRGTYDSALLAYCLRRRIAIVDATFSICALHQFHDYGHLSGGKKRVMHGAEAAFNQQSAGIRHSAPTIADAQWMLCDHTLSPNASRGDGLRALEMRLRFAHQRELIGLASRALWRVLTAMGVHQPPRVTMEQVLDAWDHVSSKDPSLVPKEVL
jgi:hypothetical protein